MSSKVVLLCVFAVGCCGQEFGYEFQFGRDGEALTHVQTNPMIVGNHRPGFRLSLTGGAVTVKEDSGPYRLGQQFATDIEDNNADTQGIQFECRNDNEELFTTKPDIVGCIKNFCVGTTDVPERSGTLVFTPKTDRFGSATVTCYALDDGVPFPVCDGPIMPCTLIACDVNTLQPCNQSPPVEFEIIITPVNDQPEFVHAGDIESPEDTAQCILNWATNVHAGGWEEGYGLQDPQELRWDIQTDNPTLFKTQPYIRYTQGATTGDLCFTPADEMTGVATAQIYLTDTGGRLDGGVDDKPPETITITITEVNDPPTFTPGELKVAVNEDAGPVDIPWATKMSPGPAAEIRAKQQLDKFVITFVNPAHKALFKIEPTISVLTGHLQFEPEDDANTFGIDCAVIVYLLDAALPPDVPMQSVKPWPVLHIEITPVNDPPSFAPPQPQKDVTVLEGQGVVDMQWAKDVCIGKKVPNCVVSEAYAGGENQKIYFELSATNKQLFSSLPQIDANGKLTFQTAEDQDGVSSVTVKQFDTGPAPNEGPSVNFVITILPVNDPPIFQTTTVFIEIDEDAEPTTFLRVLERVSPGPEAEWNQLLTAIVEAGIPEYFVDTPEFQFKTQHMGPTYADMIIAPEANRFGFTNITFKIKDDGGLENSIEWEAEVQKDAAGSIGVTYSDVDVVRVDPDGTAFAAGVRVGMKIKKVNGATVSNERLITEELLTAPDNAKFKMIMQNGTDVTYGPPILVHIKAVNDPPEFLRGDDIEVVEDTPASLAVFQKWAHKNHPGPYEETMQRLIYNITFKPDTALIAPFIAINDEGDLNFTLAPNFFGVIEVSVQVNDVDVAAPTVPLSAWSEAQMFQIKVLPVNDPPLFEISTAPLEVYYCPPADVQLIANCTRDYPNWARLLKPGPDNEADQRFDFTLTPDAAHQADWLDLFEPHHFPTVSRLGTLHFTLKRGALPAEFPNVLTEKHSIIKMQLAMHDDGGIANGGLDTNFASFELDFSNTVSTPSTSGVPRGLTILEPAFAAQGQSYVVSPVVRSIDSTNSPAVIPVGALVVCLLIPINVPEKGAVRTVFSDFSEFDAFEKDVMVTKFYQKMSQEVHTFSANATSIFEAGTYQYVYEVRLPDTTVLQIADTTFEVGSVGTTLLTLFKQDGVISASQLNEWDFRLNEMKLVINIAGNTWKAAAKAATLSLRKASGDASVNTTSHSASILVDSTTGLEITALQTTNTLSSALTTLDITVSPQPLLNIISNAELEVKFPIGSVSGGIAPASIILPLSAAPTVYYVAGNGEGLVMSEMDVVRGSRILYLDILKDTWMTGDLSYVVDAMSCTTFQGGGFNNVKNDLVSLRLVNPTRIEITLSYAGYAIDVDELVRMDTSLLRTVSGIQPDFDYNPTVFTITAVGTTAEEMASGGGKDGYKIAALVLSVVVAVCALFCLSLASPVFVCTAFAVPFFLECCGFAEDRYTYDVFEGLRWWVRPEVLKLGGSEGGFSYFDNFDNSVDAVLYAQGNVLLCVVFIVGLHFLQFLVVFLHKKSKKGATFILSSASCRYPFLWLAICFPIQTILFHNCFFIAFDGNAATAWKVIAVLLAVVSQAACMAAIVFTIRERERLAAYYDTTHWRGPDKGFEFRRKNVVFKGFYASHDDDRLAGGVLSLHEADRGANMKGVERKAAVLLSYVPERVFFAVATWVWLAVLSVIAASAAQSLSGDGVERSSQGHLIASAVLTAVYLVACVVLRALRSLLLDVVQAVCLVFTCFIAIKGQIGAIFALISLVFFAILFVAVIVVSVCRFSKFFLYSAHLLQHLTNRMKLKQTESNIIEGKRAFAGKRPGGDFIDRFFANMGKKKRQQRAPEKQRGQTQTASPVKSDPELPPMTTNPIQSVFYSKSNDSKEPLPPPVIDVDEQDASYGQEHVADARASSVSDGNVVAQNTSSFHVARSTTPVSVPSDDGLGESKPASTEPAPSVKHNRDEQE